MEENTVFEPTILEAARRYPIVIAVSAALFAVLAFLVGRLILDDWVAEASVLIEEPTASQVFDTNSATQPERYLASQVAIIESPDMAEEAQALAGGDESLDEILSSREVVTSRDTDLIGIRYMDKDPDLAVEYANAFSDAYQGYREEVTVSSFDAAVSGLNDSISLVDAELDQIDAEIEDLVVVPGSSGLEVELQAAIESLLDSNPDIASAQQLEQLVGQLQTLQLLRSLESQNPNLSLLLETRRDIMDRRSQLVIRRDQLQVDATLASTGIMARSAATGAERSLGTSRVIALGLIVGLIVGAAAAFVLALRNRRFGHRTDPETVLGVPLLAEIPRFNASASALPVIDDPSGPQAEAFRFGANAVIARVNQMELKSNVPRSMVVVTSGLLGDGKTMTTVNIGLAMATQGKAVLLVDADFGDPTLSRTLVGDTTTARGMTNVVEKTAPLADVLSAMDLGHGHHVDILTRGNVEISAGDFFDSKRTREFFSLLKSRYDYVLVDAPPLLQVSYSSTIAALSDGVIRVIPHEGKLSIQQELDDRLRLIGVETLGYVYNKAPKRPELQERHGSMRDPLGTGQLPA